MIVGMFLNVWCDRGWKWGREGGGYLIRGERGEGGKGDF